LNLFPTDLVSKLNASDADVVQLHWINGEMISIEQLGRLEKPIVWTMHDMWGFCGAEHYTYSTRYMDGYTPEGFRKSQIEDGEGQGGVLTRLDIDRWVYLRKKREWKQLNLFISPPSRWLADCSRKSDLFGHYPVKAIPNCIDLDLFGPKGDKKALRGEFDLPVDKKIILFGAMDPRVKRKGGDLLLQALGGVADPELLALAVFGNNQGGQIAGIETCNVGMIRDPEKMARLYSCSDVMCVPSRQDNLPNTCVEAHACGLPIAAFRIGGIPDIVDHLQTGYLAEPYCVDDYRRGLEQILFGSPADYDRMCHNARSKALETFSPETVVQQYLHLYKKILGR
jgi:glycosyltransferase involved in cell wall biosynthesis